MKHVNATPWRDLRFVLGAGVLGIVVVAAFLGDVITPLDPIEVRSEIRLTAPGEATIFGADEFGRDVFARAVVGSRTSLLVAASAVSLALLLGLPLGVLAAMKGGRLETLLMGLADIVFAFPAILLAIVIIAVVGPGMTGATVAIGVVFAPMFARFSRSLSKAVLSEPYIDYARCLGERDMRIALGEVVPGILPGVLVQASVALAYGILVEASLSFLGLGAQPPAPSWGSMINAGRSYLVQAPWIVLVPSVLLLVTVVSLNVLGDALREHLDPRLRNSVGGMST